jgi:uncharacterized membrane protein
MTLNKNEFINVLKKELSGLPKGETEDILLDYEIHFTEGVKHDKSEELICKELGSPREIAKLFKVNIFIEEAEKNVSTNNILRAIITSIGLGLFNLILVLGPFLGLLGVVVAIFAVSIVFVTIGVVIFTDVAVIPLSTIYFNPPVVYYMVDPVVLVALSIGLVALGVLIFVLGIISSRAIYRLSIKYLKFNLKMINEK